MTRYARDTIENERIFDAMRELIADTLKLTPRRSQVPPPAADAEITADLDPRDLLPPDNESAVGAGSEVVVDQVGGPSAASTARLPPAPASRRGKRSLVPGGHN